MNLPEADRAMHPAIEAAARAMCGDIWEWAGMGENEKSWYREAAKDAILAFLDAVAEPTKPMIGAGFSSVDWLDTLDHIGDVQKVWRAMLAELRKSVD